MHVTTQTLTADLIETLIRMDNLARKSGDYHLTEVLNLTPTWSWTEKVNCILNKLNSTVADEYLDKCLAAVQYVIDDIKTNGVQITNDEEDDNGILDSQKFLHYKKYDYERTIHLGYIKELILTILKPRVKNHAITFEYSLNIPYYSETDSFLSPLEIEALKQDKAIVIRSGLIDKIGINNIRREIISKVNRAPVILYNDGRPQEVIAEKLDCKEANTWRIIQVLPSVIIKVVKA